MIDTVKLRKVIRFEKKQKRALDEKVTGLALDPTEFSTDDGMEIHETRRRLEVECLIQLKEGCRKANINASNEMIFRFACFYDFDCKVAQKAILEKYDSHHMHLRMEGDLLHHFEALVMFPLPGLKTKDHKQDVIYMYAARHFPSDHDNDTLIENMSYILNDLSRTAEQCRNGVASIIDLHKWTFKNFTNECCRKFIQAGQGQHVPTRVGTILVVRAPSWFGKVWKVIKTMMTGDFATRVHILKDTSMLKDYLMEDYEKYLPSEMSEGWRNSEELVEDYIDSRIYDELSPQCLQLEYNHASDMSTQSDDWLKQGRT